MKGGRTALLNCIHDYTVCFGLILTLFVLIMVLSVCLLLLFL